MPAPANDNIADAELITGLTGSAGPVTIDEATAEVDEWNYQSVWYKWVAPQDGAAVFTVTGDFDDPAVVVDIFTSGVGSPAFADLVEQGYDQDVSSAHTTVDVTDGETYWIAIATYPDGATGALSLSWTLASPPANDNFADAEELAGTAGSLTSDTIIAATREVDEPDYLADPAIPAKTIWYSYLATQDGSFTIAVSPGGYEPVIQIFTGTDFDDLVLVANVDDPVSDPTPLTIPVTAGTLYYIQIGPYSGSFFPDPGLLAWEITWLFAATPNRRYVGASWAFYLADLDGATALALNPLASERRVTRLLGAASPATLAVPADDPRVYTIHDADGHDEPIVAEGVRVLLGFRDTGDDPLWEIAYTGIVHQARRSNQQGVPAVELSAWDPRKYLEALPVVDADGNLPSAKGLSFTAVKANVIARTLLENVLDNGISWLAERIITLTDGDDEDCAELTISFETGTMLGDAWNQLEETGAIDIVLDPVYQPQTDPGLLARVNFYAQAGSERDAAIFSWDRPPRSLVGIDWLEDGTPGKRANTIQGYAGQGASEHSAATLQQDATSRAKYGPYWAVISLPDQNVRAAVTAFCEEQLRLRKNGQATVMLNPTPVRSAQAIQDYDRGDRVPVYASEQLGKQLAGYSRIYGIPFVIGDEAQETVDQLIVSKDGT